MHARELIKILLVIIDWLSSLTLPKDQQSEPPGSDVLREEEEVNMQALMPGRRHAPLLPYIITLPKYYRYIYVLIDR